MTGQPNSPTGMVPRVAELPGEVAFCWEKEGGFNQTQKSQIRLKEDFLLSQAMLQVISHSTTWSCKAEPSAASSAALPYICPLSVLHPLPIQTWMDSMLSLLTEAGFLHCWQSCLENCRKKEQWLLRQVQPGGLLL